MPDKTICTNKACPLSYYCWRFNMPPKEYMQSYQEFEPEKVGLECDMYLERPDTERSNVEKLFG